jgi:energy-coupling factor transporter ATP-binding protein EcfA2/SAM-dependent methyltransferase
MGVGEWQLDQDSLEMRGLGSVVVLSGPNGGGKSRILRTIERMMQKQLSQGQLAEVRQRMKLQVSHLETEQQTIQRLKAKDGSADQIAFHTKILSDSQSELRRHQRILNACAVFIRSSAGPQSIVSLVPQKPQLKDAAGSADKHNAGLVSQLMQGKGSAGAEQCAPAYARQILREALWARDRRHELALTGVSPEEARAESLKDMIVEVLGSAFPLDLNPSWNITIGGRSDYPSALSPGQQILFQFVCILHAQGASLSDCIIVMDEPENHLHPAAIAQVVEKLREKITTGQLWIATHSVPLIAKLVATEPDCLWYVADSKPKRAGRNPELVLDGLLGGSDGARHINELTSLPAQFAALRFLSQCLQEPGAVGPTINDPQLTQIRTVLHKSDTEGATREKPLRVLDYGAGKGRLLRELSTSSELAFDYIAYDPSAAMIDLCRQELSNLNLEIRNRCFDDIHLLTSTLESGSVDAIVMCNVLHEIPPDDWLKLFGATGTLTRLLHTNGHLLIVEDYGLPKGERAHDYGFLLLDEQELRQLFSIKERDGAEQYIRYASPDPKYRKRLVAHVISQQCVARATVDSRREAIRQLRARASDRVREFLQNRASDSDAGRTYALNAQLMANSALWLEVNAAV